MAFQQERRVYGPKLSARGEALYMSSGYSIQMSTEIMYDRYDPISNPTGYISLAGAQNTLMHAELSAYYTSKFVLTDDAFRFGTDLSGSVRLNAALAGFFNTYFHAHTEVLPKHIVPGVGCSSVLDQLAFHIVDEGDAVLVAAPCFSGFITDVETRNSAKTIPVPLEPDENFFLPSTLNPFESALETAKKEGTTVRAVILCNPHNPLGQCYPRSTILAYARFCEKHDLHLIVDEIYALSTFETADVPEPRKFISALSIDLREEADCDPERVHVMYGMSKDFNANGLRMGALVSRNERLLTAMRTTAMFMKVASVSDILWSAILSDEDFLPKFMKENRRRLADAYAFFTAWLKFHGIPYLPSNAGHYLMADLRRFFPTHDSSGKSLPIIAEDGGAAGEREMLALLWRMKVVLGGSSGYVWPVKGWIRVVWATRRDHFAVTLRRIEEAFGLPCWEGLEGLKEAEGVDELAKKLRQTGI